MFPNTHATVYSLRFDAASLSSNKMLTQLLSFLFIAALIPIAFYNDTFLTLPQKENNEAIE